MTVKIDGMIHVCFSANGHEQSTDCWCEPVIIRVTKDALGRHILVVQHEDEGQNLLEHRLVVVGRRNRDVLANSGPTQGIDALWITKALTPPWRPPLPPLLHDPNERNL